MGRLILIGRWFKGKKSTVVDLKAYREMKGEREGGRTKAEGTKGKVKREKQEDSTPQGASKETKTKKRRYPWEFLI